MTDPTDPTKHARLLAAHAAAARFAGFDKALGIGDPAIGAALGVQRDMAKILSVAGGHDTRDAMIKALGGGFGGPASRIAELARAGEHTVKIARIGALGVIPDIGDKLALVGKIGQLAEASGVLRSGYVEYFAQLERKSRWATKLVGNRDDLDRLLGIGAIGKFASTFEGAAALNEQLKADQVGKIGHEASLAAGASLRDTVVKMAALAGAIDVTGLTSRASQLSAKSLLGDWVTRKDLPTEYWRDAGRAARMYRDANVDPGLIDANNADIVDVLVESGMVEGDRTRGGATVAIVAVGTQRIRITATRATSRTFETIDTLESTLKEFLDEVFTGAFGSDWFKALVDGKAAAAAKGKRRAAQRAGEPWRPLIYFLDLGALIALVINGRAWPLFENHFLDPQGFEVDIRRLIAIRNPTAHARGVDPTRMFEAMLVAHRFMAAITRSGAVDEGWDLDQ